MTREQFLNKYHFDKIEIVDKDMISYVHLYEKNGHILSLPTSIVDAYCQINLKIEDKLEYLIQYFNYDRFVQSNLYIMTHDFYEYNFIIKRIRDRYNILTKWKNLMNNARINDKYQNDIAILLERTFNKFKNSISNEQTTEIISRTLIILSKIDLSKVEFTENPNVCELYRINFSFNPYDFEPFNSLKKDAIDSKIIELVKESLEKIINDEGGVIIHDVISSFYEIINPTDFRKKYCINMLFIGAIRARFAKVLKLKSLIRDKQKS